MPGKYKLASAYSKLVHAVRKNVDFRMRSVRDEQRDVFGHNKSHTETRLLNNLMLVAKAGFQNESAKGGDGSTAAPTLDKKTELQFRNNRKQLGNLVIIHEKRGAQLQAQKDIVKPSQLLERRANDFATQRPLYMKYFRENAELFFYQANEIFDPQFRRQVASSDAKFQHLLTRYFQKISIEAERRRLRAEKASYIREYVRTGDLPNADPLDRRNTKPELVYLEQISDLDNFTKEYMLKALNSPSDTKHIQMKRRKERSRNLLASKLKFSVTPRVEKTTTQQKTLSPNLENSKNSAAGTQQQAGEALSAVSARTTPNNNNAQHTSHTHAENSPAMAAHQQVLQRQDERGYFVIRRNQSHEQMHHFQDLQRDDSDDSKDGSLTEAQLEIYYRQAKEHQEKLRLCASDGIIKKLRHIIRLDEVKKNIHETNLNKFAQKV